MDELERWQRNAAIEMSGFGIAQLLILVICVGGTTYYLGLSPDRGVSPMLLLLGSCCIVPTIIVGAFTLHGYSVKEIVLEGKAGVTFAIPIGIGMGFLISAAAGFVRKRRESYKDEGNS